MTDAKPTYAAGELIDITIRAARVRGYYGAAGALDDGEPTDLMVSYGASDLNLDLGAKGVTVERIAPAEWPPLPGDLWRSAQAPRQWLAGDLIEERGPYVPMLNAAGRVLYPDEMLRDYGPVELVYREPAPADTEGGAS